MRVQQVEAFPLRWAYPAPIWDARSRIARKTAVLVKVTSDKGLVGWGEAASFGEVPEIVSALVRGPVAALVRGAEVSPRVLKERMLRSTAHFGQRGVTLSAISGIEIALWDLLGKEAGLPICKLLGGEPRPVRVYAACGYYADEHVRPSADDLERELAARPFERFSGLKIKIGRAGLADDVERVRVARRALGPGRLLIVDANNGYSVREAVRFAKAIESMDVLFLEEPIEFGNPTLSLEVKRASPVAIGGYELEGQFSGFRPYIEAGALDIVQPDAVWSGGISECLAISDYAKRHGVQMIPHNFSTIVALAANYQTVCAADNGDLIEYDATGSPFVTALAPAAYPVHEGTIVGPNKPGLGIEIDERDLAPFASTAAS